MQGLILDQQGLHYVTNTPLPEPGPGEVRVKVTCAGICETDLQLKQGYMGFQGILGHEFVGIAESGRYAGERVVGEINCACRQCEMCRRGIPSHCPHRTVLGILGRHGAFADYLVLPEENLHVIPETVTDQAAVFTEPLAAAFQIPVQIPDLAGKQTLVLGDGRLGNLCAQVLRLSGAEVTVVGKHPEKLRLLQELQISTAVLTEFSSPRVWDVVVDATGNPSGFSTALAFLRPRGMLVLKTTVAARQELHLAPLVIDEITVIGSRCGPFPPALEALRTGQVQVAPLINSVRPLREGVAAFEALQRTRGLKTLLIP